MVLFLFLSCFSLPLIFCIYKFIEYVWKYSFFCYFLEAVAIPLYLSWSIFRTERAQVAATANGMREVTLEKSGPLRDEFAKAFNGEGNRIFMKHMLPKFIKVNNEGNALPVSGFLSPMNRTSTYSQHLVELN